MERLEVHEIQKKYPDEWVLIIEPETDELLHIRSGIVVMHSPKRREIYAKLQKYPERRAIYYTGDLSKHKLYAL